MISLVFQYLRQVKTCGKVALSNSVLFSRIVSLNLSTTEGRSAESYKKHQGRHLAADFNLSEFRGEL
jgi:hypothetical protein